MTKINSLLVVSLIMATLMISQMVYCDVSIGKSIKFISGTEEVVSPNMFGKKIVGSIFGSTCSLSLKRNGKTYKYFTVHSNPTQFTMIYDSIGDTFSFQPDLLSFCTVTLELSYDDLYDYDLPSSYQNLEATDTSNMDLHGSTPYKVGVPRGMKIKATVYMVTLSTCTISTPYNVIFSEDVNYSYSGKQYEIELVATASEAEIFEINVQKDSFVYSVGMTFTLVNATSADTPSRLAKKYNFNAETKALVDNVANTIIGVIFGILAFCCVCGAIIIIIPMVFCGGCAALGVWCSGKNVNVNTTTIQNGASATSASQNV